MGPATARPQLFTISRATLWLYENLGKALNQGEGFYPAYWAEAIEKLKSLERLLGKSDPRVVCHWEPLTQAAIKWLAFDIAEASKMDPSEQGASEAIKERLKDFYKNKGIWRICLNGVGWLISPRGPMNYAERRECATQYLNGVCIPLARLEKRYNIATGIDYVTVFHARFGRDNEAQRVFEEIVKHRINYDCECPDGGHNALTCVSTEDKCRKQLETGPKFRICGMPLGHKGDCFQN